MTDVLSPSYICSLVVWLPPNHDGPHLIQAQHCPFLYIIHCLDGLPSESDLSLSTLHCKMVFSMVPFALAT